MLVGTHQVPVLKGKPSHDILQQLTTMPCEQVLESQTWTNRNKYVSPSLSHTTARAIVHML